MNILFFDRCATAREQNGIGRVSCMLSDCFRADGCETFFLGANRDLEKCAEDPTHQFFLPDARRSRLACAENRQAFARLLDEQKISLVIFQWGEGRRFPFVAECAARGVQVISVIHFSVNHNESRLRAHYAGANFFARKILLPLKLFRDARKSRKIYRWNAAHCAATVLLSERFKPEFFKHFSNAHEAGTVLALPNPATFPAAVDFPAKKRELLFVGRMEKTVKQPHLLLQIWAKLEARFPAWSLRLVGGGYDFDEIRALAETLGLRRAFFEGFQKPEKFYRDASIFCMTSAYEGFPMVLVEASAFGCVPVAFDSFAAVHDIISDGENGALVPAFDSEKYAETLARLMADDAERERLARAALKIPEKFSPEKIADRWLNFFDKCAGTPFVKCK